MDVKIRKLNGGWDLGYALHKHTLSSVHIGTDNWGHPRFDTTRSEPGEALFQLKYRNDLTQITPLAKQIQIALLPLFGKVDLIVPVPATTARAKQPVDQLANALGELAKIPVFADMVVKTMPTSGTGTLKDLHSRAEKDAALAGRFTLNECITNDGRWDVLLLDDLFDTGATMDAVCQALRTYRKINRIYVAAITWK
ncbi:MAG TPA: hypothetical protein VGN16_14075 [Acidobacteriaceae bacterium]|jgi:predicted amidophosphoribosyltransferase